MAAPKFYLDKRFLNKQGKAMLKIAIRYNNKVAYVPTPVYLVPDKEWDGEKIVGMKNAVTLMIFLNGKKQRIEEKLLELDAKGELISLSPKELVAILAPKEDAGEDTKTTKEGSSKENKDNFKQYFLKYCSSRRKEKTADTYRDALRKMAAYMDSEDYPGNGTIDNLRFDDITKEWLLNFQKWMLSTGCSLNTCNVHFRSIRAVFNDAIDNEITDRYPFRKLKMKTVRTVKRSLPVDELRNLFEVDCEEELKKYLDIFKLTFMLIGINMVDLMSLKDIKQGRIEYTRSKTYRPYSIKVEPEALAIIERYRGEHHLLEFADRYRNHVDFLRRVNRGLKSIGPVETGKHGKKLRQPLYPEITTYWARHSWATIAASLDIPKETIAAALGHGGNTVTDIYIDFDRDKIDEANRRVLDWVLYGKR